jgi:hypothetical protein
MGIKLNKKDFKLIAAGFLTLLCLVGILIFVIKFVIKSSRQILGVGENFQPAALQFNLNGLKEINDKLPTDLRV